MKITHVAQCQQESFRYHILPNPTFIRNRTDIFINWKKNSSVKTFGTLPKPFATPPLHVASNLNGNAINCKASIYFQLNNCTTVIQFGKNAISILWHSAIVGEWRWSWHAFISKRSVLNLRVRQKHTTTIGAKAIPMCGCLVQLSVNRAANVNTNALHHHRYISWS